MIELATAEVNKSNNRITVSFEIPKPKDLYTGVVVTNIAEKLGNSLATTFTNDLFVRFQSGKMGDYFGFFDKTGQNPLLNNFVFSQDSLIIKDLQNTDRKMMVLKYSHDFDPAQSPTATMPRSVTRALYLDTLYYVDTNKPFKLNDQALYYFCRDTTESYGLGILGVDNRFPKYTRPETMTKPLTYMSTNQEMAEWGKATTTEEAKRAIDRFFLTLTNGNQQVAKRIIKNYYSRIEQANQFFTTYKEGWKTDKGMIHIIMGKPDKVQRSKDKEIWSYSRRGQPSDINFTFLRRPNQFIDDHYELTRYPEYQSFWFPVVEAWRIGEIAGN
jgi:GWxTD domain-containing protein